MQLIWMRKVYCEKFWQNAFPQFIQNHISSSDKHECPYETFCVCTRASIDTNLNIYVVEQVQSQII